MAEAWVLVRNCIQTEGQKEVIPDLKVGDQVYIEINLVS